MIRVVDPEGRRGTVLRFVFRQFLDTLVRVEGGSDEWFALTSLRGAEASGKDHDRYSLTSRLRRQKP